MQMAPKSIRQKIKLGFYFLLLCIVAMAGLTYGIVHEVEYKLETLEIIDDLLNMTLEVRRFEKNYFLYGKEEDYLDNTAFLNELGKHLLENEKVLTPLSWERKCIMTCGARYRNTRKTSKGSMA